MDDTCLWTEGSVTLKCEPCSPFWTYGWKDTRNWCYTNQRKWSTAPPLVSFYSPLSVPSVTRVFIKKNSCNQLSKKDVPFDSSGFGSASTGKLIASPSVSQRSWASQNISGKKKFITKLKFLISNPVVSNLWNYMINSFAGSAVLGACNPMGSY